MLIFCRGLGDVEGRTRFTWIESLAGIPITTVFAGGHHTWGLIDSQSAFKNERYIPPSPLLTTTPMKQRRGHSTGK